MGAFQIVFFYFFWIASFLAMTLRVVVIARNEAIQKIQYIKYLKIHHWQERSNPEYIGHCDKLKCTLPPFAQASNLCGKTIEVCNFG